MPESPQADEFGRVRVTDKDTGHRLSVTLDQLRHGNFTVLKADASNPLTGEALPPEHNVAKPSTTGQQADNTKES